MAKGIFIVVHEQPIMPFPEQWEAYWKQTLKRDAVNLYEGLANEEFAGVEVDAERFLRFYGMGAARFGRALKELEEAGFAWIDPDDDPPHVTIRPVPEIGPEIKPLPKPPENLPPRKQVWAFIAHWSLLWERYLGDRYPRPSRGKNQDVYFLHKLLETYSVETLKQVADWFFLHRRKNEPATIKYFWHKIEELMSEYKDKGGSIIVKNESLLQEADGRRTANVD